MTEKLCAKCHRPIHREGEYWIDDKGYVSCGIREVFHEPTKQGMAVLGFNLKLYTEIKRNHCGGADRRRQNEV